MNEPSKKLAALSPAQKRALLAQLLREKAEKSDCVGEGRAKGEGTERSERSEDVAPRQSAQARGMLPMEPLAPLLSAGNESASSRATLEAATFPISHNQKALWFLYHLTPSSAAYNLLYAARLHSELALPALRSAVQTLARRYPILTSTYTTRNGEPVQIVHPEREIPFAEIDATSWTLDMIRERLYLEANAPISLEQGPLLRIEFYRHAPNEYVLALIAHHIAVDFWALDILVDELYLLYAATRAGLPAPLPPPAAQNADYVRWQNEMLGSPEGEQHARYWQELLSGELPLLALPTDRPRPPTQTHKGASHSFALAPELTQRLRILAQAQKVTLFTLLLTAFQTLLFRYTNQEDIIVGTPALGRTRSDLERVVGYLANPVLIRAQFANNPTFQELLQQTRTGVFAALEHQDFPFPLLVERLQPRRDPSFSPLYQTLFIWDRPRIRNNADLARLGKSELGQSIAQEGLELEPFVYGQQGAPFDLTLTIFEIDGNLSADFRYNVDLFDPATLTRLEHSFQALLVGIVAHPDQHVLELPVLSTEERRRQLIEWNATVASYPDSVALHTLIEQQAERTPDNVALLFEGEERTYRELNSEANRLAHALQDAGIGPDTLVGVCMERSFEMVVALLGVLKAGGAYVPLDPSYPQERLSYMLEDSHVAVLLTQSRVRANLPALDIPTLVLDPGWSASFAEREQNPTRSVGPDNLIYMIYTSGSTGRPKGVMNTHRSLCNRLHWMQQAYGLTVADRVLQKTPFSFDVSVWEFFWPLLTGASIVIARPNGHTDTAYLADLIASQKVTTLHFVPSMLQAFLLEANLNERCKSLRHVVCSGEALTLEQQQRFFAQFPDRVELHNLYGPTEAAIDVTHWECTRDDTQKSNPPIGYPIANTHLYILNPALQPVPVGVTGELYIGGVGVARGYHNRPELTAEKFIRDPFSPDDQVERAQLFKTGDLARYRPDGAIEFLGRIDSQVKLHGFRIELGEIEAELRAHPSIEDVTVVAREDTPGNKRLVAYLVARPGTVQPSIEELRNALRQKLPSYMLPAVFLFLDALPLSPNGKVDRKALPVPDSTRPELESAFVAPTTPTEQTLAGIWTEVLDLDRVGRNDNYFDLGGGSLQSLDLISKANAAGLPLKLEMLFEHQTIAELASAIDAQQTSSLNAEAQASAPADTAIASTEATAPMQSAPQLDSPELSELRQAHLLIESLGTYLPEKIVSSEELVQGCVKPLRFPMSRLTGIKNRRVVGEKEFAIDIAKRAVAECLANSRYNPQDIDLLISCSISRGNSANTGPEFWFEPNQSIQLKRYFGFSNALAFDISNACTSLFTGMYVADAYLKTGRARRALVVSGEYISHLAMTAQKEIEDYMDSRLACLTVGDGGAAMILELTEDKQIGTHEFEMYTLGHYSEACIGVVTDREHGGAIMYTDAVQVSTVNMKQAISHAGYIIDRAQWAHDAFKHIIVHQTSKTTIQDVARAFNKYFGAEVCSQENVINNIAERGNTASTTHMIAVMDNIRNGHISNGDNVIFGITGSGATIGTLLYTFDDLPERIRKREAGEYTPQKIQPKDTSSHLDPSPLNRSPQNTINGLSPVSPNSLGENRDPIHRVRRDSSPPHDSSSRRDSSSPQNSSRTWTPPNNSSRPRIRVESIGTVPPGAQLRPTVQSSPKTLELIRIAAENCFSASTYQRDETDLLLYSGIYRDRFICEPAVAALVAGVLDINVDIDTQQQKKTFALDILNGGLGTLTACHAAITMIQAGKANNALIVTSELENNRELWPENLLGIEETGSALFLDASPDGSTGFDSFLFKSFPDYSEAIQTNSMTRHGKSVLQIRRDPCLESYYIPCIRATVDEFLQCEGLDLSQIRVILPPQVSPAFFSELCQALQVTSDRMVDLHPEHDLSTNALAYTLQHVRQHMNVQPGDLALIISVGSGIQVGCATYIF